MPEYSVKCKIHKLKALGNFKWIKLWMNKSAWRKMQVQNTVLMKPMPKTFKS